MFSCEFCEIFKNTFFTEHLRATASEASLVFWLLIFFVFNFSEVHSGPSQAFICSKVTI